MLISREFDFSKISTFGSGVAPRREVNSRLLSYSLVRKQIAAIEAAPLPPVRLEDATTRCNPAVEYGQEGQADAGPSDGSRRRGLPRLK